MYIFFLPICAKNESRSRRVLQACAVWIEVTITVLSLCVEAFYLYISKHFHKKTLLSLSTFSQKEKSHSQAHIPTETESSPATSITPASPPLTPSVYKILGVSSHHHLPLCVCTVSRDGTSSAWVGTIWGRGPGAQQCGEMALCRPGLLPRAAAAF